MWWEKKEEGKKKNASRPDALTSNSVVEITVLSYCSLFLGGTIYTSHDRVCAGLGGVSRRGFMKQPDSLRNGNVRYLTEVFFALAPPVLLSSAVCAGEYRGLGAIQYRHFVDVL